MIEIRIQALTDHRDVVASRMKALLNAAAFNGQALDERQATKLIEQGEDLLERACKLAQE